jgi:hypothetical protein
MTFMPRGDLFPSPTARKASAPQVLRKGYCRISELLPPDLLEPVRMKYLQDLRDMRLRGADANARSLHVGMQSLLQILAANEILDNTLRYVNQGLEQLDKVPLGMRLCDELPGNRPAAMAFIADNGIPDEVLGLLGASGAAYIKMDGMFRGENVYRISRAADGLRVECPFGRSYTTDSPAGIDLGGDGRKKTFIAESEIPIARTVDGRTWELRMIPVGTDVFACGKLGKEGSHVNNIARGGSFAMCATIISDVERTRGQGDWRAALPFSSQFFDAASGLALHVKGITDAIQLEIARLVVRPEDLRDPAAYDTIMERAFSGTFFVVDITGVWDERRERLIPIVVEAQSSGGIPEEIARSTQACKLASGLLKQKSDFLKANLRA